MNSKGHLTISIIKSAIRILASIPAVMSNNIALSFLGTGLIIAEIAGIVEELVDKR